MLGGEKTREEGTYSNMDLYLLRGGARRDLCAVLEREKKFSSRREILLPFFKADLL